MTTIRLSRILWLPALLAVLGSAQAQTHTEQARVISSQPAAQGGYTVTYEYAGRRYTTTTAQPPGPTLPVQISAYGVTTSPVRPQPSLQARPLDDPGVVADSRAAWEQVRPEPGVVVSANPAYAQPAYPPVQPVYVAPPPVYVQPAYSYPAPYYAAPYYGGYPPVGFSINLGYSRGWRGGGWHHRHWR